MKNYKINFDAVTTNDDVVGNFTLCINLPEYGVADRRVLALRRLCVEYARLNNVSCSFADIKSIETA